MREQTRIAPRSNPSRRLALAAALACIALPAAAGAAPTPGGYQENDAGGFRNILPPGQGSNANAAEIAAFQADGTYPAGDNDNDQLQMYEDLVYSTPGLADAEIDDFYKDASFGVQPGDIVDTYSPRDDVTIQRDGFGVPHIYGQDRPGAMFGIGYASAEDRLFFMDVLRHSGRAQLSSFIGGDQGNRDMDRSVWADTPYNESELQEQYDRADELYGARGELIQTDVQNYIAGINQYITEACVDPTEKPGEYGLINPANDICLLENRWKVTDVIATASLVAGIFGKGGGGELDSALVLEAAQARFGEAQGRQVWEDFRSAEDPEAPTTAQGVSFPYQVPPAEPRGLALPDPGTVNHSEVVVASTGGRSADAASDLPGGPDLLAPLREASGASNALLVSASESESGQPIAVMGPQVSYFSPQILMEQDVHAPGTPGAPPIDARGSAFPGTNLYVQLGRGRDYAWSATSAGQDIIDTYALRLCDPDGTDPPSTENPQGYRFRGQCRAFDVLERTNTWVPTAADQTPAGSETLRTLRSQLGMLIATAELGGKPFAFTRLRSTYFHEVDPSALGFADFNNPNKMDSPAEFMQAANKIDYTFNWFYVNRDEIAYFNSGSNPVRPPYVDPNFPVRGRNPYLWRDFDPDLLTERQAPQDAHPHVIDQRFITSWNNKQAPGYRAADDNYSYQPVHRSDSLDERVKQLIQGTGKASLAELISAMEDAGTVDLRGSQVLPWALKVIATQPVSDPDLSAAIKTLRAWARSGAHRRDADQSGTYDDAEAVRIMDAWWPRLLEAQFKPALGDGLFGAVRSMVGFDDPPGPVGSAYISGWFGYAEKDLRTILGAPVAGSYSRVYCGAGDLAACRQGLLDSLADALAHDSDAELYGTEGCTDHDGVDHDPQWCHDAVGHRAVGAITQPPIHWINRPTFQQAVEIAP